MPLLQSFGPLHSPPTSAPFGLPAGGGVTPFSCAAGSSGEMTEHAASVSASAARDPRTVVFIVRMRLPLASFPSGQAKLQFFDPAGRAWWAAESLRNLRHP